MSKLVRVCFFVIGLLLTMQHSFAEEGVRGRLVDTSWLARNLKSSDLVLLDASPETYGKGHIPGAQSVNIYDLFAYGFGGISDSKIEEDFRSWGVGPEKKIVMYDSGGQELATRLFFDLDYHGVPEQNLFILDGGLSKWKKEALPLSTERVPSPKNGTFKLTKLNEDLRGGLPEVLDATGDTTHNALLEGLGPDWHYGQIAPFSKAGHIPTGILTPVGDFYNADKTFKSPKEIRQMLTFLGVKEEQQIYTYCGGGVAATVPYFAAKYVAGYPKVKL
ncbi:MAG: sulfurtransferase, partial [Acidobacteria bacterium]|nr:sulfurtransferase [Acidobacteriota bacterium]